MNGNKVVVSLDVRNDRREYTLSQLCNLPFVVVNSYDIEPSGITIDGHVHFYAVPAAQWRRMKDAASAWAAMIDEKNKSE